MRYFLVLCVALGLAITGCSSEKEPTPAPMTVAEEQADEIAVSEEITRVEEEVTETAAETVEAVTTNEIVEDVVQSGETTLDAAKAEMEQMKADKAAADKAAADKAAADKAAADKAAAAKAAAAKAAAAKAAAAKAAASAVTVAAASSDNATVGAGKIGKCKACHSFDAGGSHKVGPNLFGIYAKTAGKVAGFSKYGSDLKGATFVWDEAKLAEWVCDSKAGIKSLTGNSGAKSKMPKQNKCGTDAQDIAAYLKSLH